jgi:hypothetical protein
MQPPNIENIGVDETNQRTYIVLAHRVTDGELYKAIRQEILNHGGKRPARGETLTFSFAAAANRPAAA